MKVGITVWGDVISPVFDSAGSLLVIETNGDTVAGKKRLPMAPGYPVQQVQLLCQSGIEVLICGAVSEMPANMIENAGIHLIPFIAGHVDEVVQAFLKRQLQTDFMMPGCGLRRRSRKRGRRP